MNAEKVFDAVHNTAEEAADFVPQLRTRVRNALPQTLDEVSAHLCHLLDVAGERQDKTHHNLWHRLDDFHNDGGRANAFKKMRNILPENGKM
jgi:hypothetical protein